MLQQPRAFLVPPDWPVSTRSFWFLLLQDPFPSWHRRGQPGSVDHAERLVRTDATEDGTDGFFVAVFQKQVTRTAITPCTNGDSGMYEEPLSCTGGLCFTVLCLATNVIICRGSHLIAWHLSSLC